MSRLLVIVTCALVAVVFGQGGSDNAMCGGFVKPSLQFPPITYVLPISTRAPSVSRLAAAAWRAP